MAHVRHGMEGLEIGAGVDNGDAHFDAIFRSAFAGGHNGYFGVGDCDMHELRSFLGLAVREEPGQLAAATDSFII
jgi:hypothetical protein